jgi:hypothetical protein
MALRPRAGTCPVQRLINDGGHTNHVSIAAGDLHHRDAEIKVVADIVLAIIGQFDPLEW